MIVSVSEYIADFFASNGIEHCFMVTGGGAMHLNNAIGHKNGIKCIFNHHEQASAIAAEAYARMTGKIAAVCVTSGPGGTNAITGVIGGWLDSIPMFVVSGQVKYETTTYSCRDLGLRQLGDQEFDIVGSVSNTTKYAVVVTKAEDIAYHLEKALFLAYDGRPGPVWLDIPLDIQGAKIDTDSLRHFDKQAEFPKNESDCTDTVNTVLDKIKAAKAPLLLAGTGIRVGSAEKEFLSAVEKLKIPVVTAWNANDLLAFDNPYYVGMPGTVGIRSGNFAVQNCDLLISLGCRLNIRMIGYNRFDFAKNAYKIIVDIDEKELKKPTVIADMPINADVKEFLSVVNKTAYTPSAEHEKWTLWCRSLLKRYPATLNEYHSTDKKINPYVFVDNLFDQLDNYDRIICGNGSACVVTFQAGKIKQGQRMFTNSGCAAMGYGLPAALGVAVSDNEKRTICLDGDGSIMMNIQELATISYNRLNTKIFILNNNGYHSIRQTQMNLFNSGFVGIDKDSGLLFPDFEIVAKAFFIDYFRIEKENGSVEIINDVLNSNGPCICEVLIDEKQSFEPKSASKVLPDGRIISPSIDDMKPFLDRDEFNAIRYI